MAFSLLALAIVASAQTPIDQRISYSIEKKSVQYVVIDLAAKVGLGYDWDKSAAQTDPERRRWVNNLSIENEPFDSAMQRVLQPVGLRYEIEGNKVVLYRAAATAGPAKAPTDQLINYSVDRKSVQYVVIDLAAMVGLGYNWDKSAAQTDPERRHWVDNLKIKNRSFDGAMKRVLDPVGLRYEIEGNQVVLYRR
jgi:hypothetical protein